MTTPDQPAVRRDQLEDLIARADQLQAQATDQEDVLSQDDLDQIARGVGIESVYLQAALREAQSPPLQHGSERLLRLLGLGALGISSLVAATTALLAASSPLLLLIGTLFGLAVVAFLGLRRHYVLPRTDQMIAVYGLGIAGKKVLTATDSGTLVLPGVQEHWVFDLRITTVGALVLDALSRDHVRLHASVQAMFRFSTAPEDRRVVAEQWTGIPFSEIEDIVRDALVASSRTALASHPADVCLGQPGVVDEIARDLRRTLHPLGLELVAAEMPEIGRHPGRSVG